MITVEKFNERVKENFLKIDEVFEFSTDADFDEAKEWAEEHDCELHLITKRDGDHFWKDHDEAYDPIMPSEKDYSDDHTFLSGESGKEFLHDMAKEIVDDCETFDEMIKKLQELKAVEEDLDVAGDDEYVVMIDDDHFRLGKRVMSHDYDVYHQKIVAIKFSDKTLF